MPKQKIGFDSCSVSGIVEYMNVNKIFMESCEAARFSAAVNKQVTQMVDEGLKLSQDMK